MFVICFHYTLIALIAITNLRYADDTTLLASTQERIRKFIKDLTQESARYIQHVYQCTEVQNNGGQQTRQYFRASGP